ncbi:MAG: hypothetical protein QF384_08960, partial [Alphaproteobacteria bacterium]|nr:hypothetical protein [Alphaproteobacteria bacterium]
TARWKRQERCFFMTTNLAKWVSNNGQIIKSGLPNDRRAKFLPSVVGFAYDLLRYEYYLGNIGLMDIHGAEAPMRFMKAIADTGDLHAAARLSLEMDGNELEAGWITYLAKVALQD